MNELTFLDLIILKKTTPDSSVENFGSMINTSFFETANLLGTVKIKGYIDIESSVGGISKVTLTDAGQGILALAEKRKAEPIEPLDNAILHALAGGAKSPELLQAQLNIRSGDIAYHVLKLVEQGFMDYGVRSAKVSFVLTEQGFNATGGVRVQQKLPEIVEGANAEKNGHEEAHAEHKGNKEDVAHILGMHHEHNAQAHEGQAHHEHAEHGHHEHPHAHHAEGEKKEKELSPDEHKKAEKQKRMLSKLQHYLVEYSLWLVLVFIVVAIFFGAIFLLLSRNGL